MRTLASVRAAACMSRRNSTSAGLSPSSKGKARERATEDVDTLLCLLAGCNVPGQREEQQVCRSQKNKINGKFEEKSSNRLRFWWFDYRVRRSRPVPDFANPMNEKGFCDD